MNINAEDFYSGNADYLQHVTKVLAQNGPAVLKAFHARILNQQSRAAGSGQSAGSLADLQVPLNELSSSAKGNPKFGANHSSNSSADLSKMSGQITVKYSDGSKGGYYLYLTPHSSSKGNNLKGGPNAANSSSSRNTYIALDVNMFYSIDDENGEEQWPVTIPAQSMNNPDKKIKVTIHKDGKIDWPKEAYRGTSNSFSLANQLSSVSSQNNTPELMYVSGDGVGENLISPCLYDGNGGGCSSGGGGGGGGGSTTPSWTSDIPTMDKVTSSAPFLAIKSIRLDDRRETGNAAEALMEIEGDNDAEIDSRWDYAFDQKYGAYGFRDLLNGISFRSFAGAVLHPGDIFNPGKLANKIFNNALAQSNVYQGRNRRTTGFDGAVYEVPDINDARVTYNFTNMRTFVPDIYTYDIGLFNTNQYYSQVQNFVEVGRSNYLPIIPLYSKAYRLVMVEDDHNYPDYANRSQSGGRAYKEITTFDMATGQSHVELTGLESKSVGTGSSDDTYGNSGVKNVTAVNVGNRLTNGEIIVRHDDWRYEFTVVNRTVLCEPNN